MKCKLKMTYYHEIKCSESDVGRNTGPLIKPISCKKNWPKQVRMMHK